MSTRWLDKSLLGRLFSTAHAPAQVPFQPLPMPHTVQPAALEHAGLRCSFVPAAPSQEDSWGASPRAAVDLPLAEALRKLCGE